MSGYRLAGRRILVCGGATGIGAATARIAASQGAAIRIQYRTRTAEATRLCDELRAAGASVEISQADITSEKDVGRLAAEVGDVHGVVHSVSPPLPRASADRTQWSVFEEHWTAAVKALFMITRSFVPSAASLDSIVAVLSSVVLGPPPKDMAAYVTAKHALYGFCRALAVELAPRKIRVNCVSPGLTPTPLTSHVDPRHHDILGRAVPLGRLGTPDDAAHVIAFLLGAEAAYLTGANIPVAGGAVMS